MSPRFHVRKSGDKESVRSDYNFFHVRFVACTFYSFYPPLAAPFVVSSAQESRPSPNLNIANTITWHLRPEQGELVRGERGGRGHTAERLQAALDYACGHGADCSATERNHLAVAFVSFFTHQAALSAMAALNGTVFDPETGDCLHIELAKSSSRKRHGGDDIYRVIDKRVDRTEGNADHENIGDEGVDVLGEDDDGGNDGEGGSEEPLDTENDNTGDKNELPADQSGQPGLNQQNGQSPSNDHQDKSSVDIPPCSTLFVANLGHTCTEEELKEVLSKQPGFHALKMRRRGGMPVVFADFMDIESSTAAMNNLQGTMLSSPDSDGLHIEYARSKMRKT